MWKLDQFLMEAGGFGHKCSTQCLHMKNSWYTVLAKAHNFSCISRKASTTYPDSISLATRNDTHPNMDNPLQLSLDRAAGLPGAD